MIRWYDEEHNATVVYISMPVQIRGVVCLNDDDSFTIVINANLSEEKQKRAYLHEIRHIVNDDFYSHGDVNEIERKVRDEASGAI